MFQINVVEKTKTHFVLSNICFENRAVYEIMWKNIVEPGMPHVIVRCMRITCWIPKTTNTHSDYVIIMFFPLQQWFCTNAPQCYVFRTLPFLFVPEYDFSGKRCSVNAVTFRF